jgi:hypothetical protein
MSAALSGKLSHYWDMQGVDRTNTMFHTANIIPDRIGSADISFSDGSVSNTVYMAGSGISVSGIQRNGTLSGSNNEMPIAQLWAKESMGTVGNYETQDQVWGPGSGSFTFSWWQYETGSMTSNSYMPCLAGGFGSSDTSHANTCYFHLRKTDGTNHIGIRSSSNILAENSSISVPTVPQNKWNMWTVVIDKIAGDVDIYINASGTSALSGNSTVQDMKYPGSYSSMQSCGLNFTHFLASSIFNEFDASQWDHVPGLTIDEAMVFGEALSSSEITELYNSGSGAFLPSSDASVDIKSVMQTNLKHYYDFAGSGVGLNGTLNDQVGTAHLTLKSQDAGATGGFFFAETTDATNADKVPGNHASGNQSVDWYFERKLWDGTTGTEGDHALVGSGDWTVSFWKYGGLDSNIQRSIMSVVNETESDSTTDGDPLVIRHDGDFGPHHIVGVYNTHDGANNEGPQTNNLSTTAWEHIMLSYDRDNQSMLMFVNGELDAVTEVKRGGNVIGQAYVGLEASDDYFFRLHSGSGHKATNATSSQGVQDQSTYFIDEIAIFDTALDIRHSKELYNSGNGYYWPLPVEYPMSSSLVSKLSHYWDLDNHSTGVFGGEKISDRIGNMDLTVGRVNNLNNSAARSTNYEALATPVSGCWPSGTTLEHSGPKGHGTDPLDYANPAVSMNAMIASKYENDIAENLGSGTGGKFTFNSWVYYGAPSGTNTNYKVGGVFGTALGDHSWSMNIRHDGTLRGRVRSQNMDSSSVVPSGQWAMCTLCVDKTAGDADLYINGSGVASLTGEADIQIMSVSSYGNYSNTNNTFGLLGEVGVDSEENGILPVTHLPSGKIDEVSYFGDYLTAGEISELYNSGNGAFYRGSSNTQLQDEGSSANPSGTLVHHYSFDQGSSFIADGGTLFDSVGNAHLTLKGTPNTSILDGSTGLDLVSADGFHYYTPSGSQNGNRHFQRVIKSLGSDTVDSSLNVFSSAQMKEPFSISFWRKNPDRDVVTTPVVGVSWSGVDTTNTLAASGKLVDLQFGSRLYVGGRSDETTLSASPNISSAEVGKQSSPTIGSGTVSGWINHIVTVDPSTGAFAAYDNGHVSQAGTNQALTDMLNTSSVVTSGYACELTIGARSDYTSSDVWWTEADYQVDEISIFSGWITSTQAKQLYNNGSGTLPTYISSGTLSPSLGGYVYANGIESGSSSTSVGGYVYANGVENGSSSISAGGFVLASGELETTGSITQARPAATIWEYDTTKVDPTGYRHVESGIYKPAAKKGVIGGFVAQNETTGNLSLISQTDLSPASTVTGPTKCVVVNISDPNGLYFDAATETISSDRGIYNVKMWLNDQSAVSASGVSATVYYKKQSQWDKDISLTSGSAGVAAFPTTEGTAIELGDINARLTDSEVSDYVYMFVEMPAGTYGPGTIGGDAGGYSVRVTYDFSGEGATD